MSCNRENVIWPSRDGTWNRAFYDFYEVGDPSTRDYEWDVEYTDEFNWVTRGWATEEGARLAWDGVNPGGASIYLEPNEHTDELDKKAARYVSEHGDDGRRPPPPLLTWNHRGGTW